MNAIDLYYRLRYYPAQLPTQKQLAATQELIDIIGGDGDIAAIDGLAIHLGPLFHEQVGKYRSNFDLQDWIPDGGQMDDVKWLKSAVTVAKREGAENITTELQSLVRRISEDAQAIKSGRIGNFNLFHPKTAKKIAEGNRRYLDNAHRDPQELQAIVSNTPDGKILVDLMPRLAEWKIPNDAATLARAKENMRIIMQNPAALEYRIPETPYRNNILHAHIMNMHEVTPLMIIEAAAEQNAIQSGTHHFEQREIAGKTPLQMAVIAGKLNLVEALLNAGADPNTQDNALSTPLHKAALRGNLAMVELLIHHGADINLTDKDDLTPLDKTQAPKSEVEAMMAEHDIDPKRHYKATASVPLRIVAPTDQSAEVCVSGKPGEKGFEGHEATAHFLQTKGAKRGVELEALQSPRFADKVRSTQRSAGTGITM